MPERDVTDEELSRHLDYLRLNFEETGEPLAAIQAFVAATKNGREPESWSLKFVTERFDQWLTANGAADGVRSGHVTLDQAFSGGRWGVGRKAFRQAQDNTFDRRVAQKVFLVRWAFGVSLDVAVEWAVTGGIVDNPSDERDIAHWFARKQFAKHYSKFCDQAESGGWSRRQTAEYLIRTVKNRETQREMEAHLAREFTPE